MYLYLSPKRNCAKSFFLVCQPDNDHICLKYIANLI